LSDANITLVEKDNLSQSVNEIIQVTEEELKQKYERIKQSGIDRLFIHSEDVYSVINELIKKQPFNKDSVTNNIEQVGSSFLEQPIYKITLGTGPINLFLWSQMHGDESAATASLFDLINYTKSQENKVWFDSWRTKITLHIVPMLNPDGAELEQRVNAQGIDINRDAKALQSPEGRLLLFLAEQIKPQFGFNLHSQNRFYTVGKTDKSAIISLLAPAYNDDNDTNKSRKNAKQIISVINRAIQRQYPNHVGRYDDTYSYRSFGDLFSAKGISTILIESGYYKDDHNRQIPRWLTFLSLVESINSIAEGRYVEEPLEAYDVIPFNTEDGLVDVLLKNLTINDQYQIDMSINYDDYFKCGIVESIGDLSTVTGLQTIDLTSYKIQPMLGYILNEKVTLSLEKYKKLLREGYGYFKGEQSLLTNNSNLPVSFSQPINGPSLNQPANFLFSKDEKVSLAILDGLVIDLETGYK